MISVSGGLRIPPAGSDPFHSPDTATVASPRRDIPEVRTAPPPGLFARWEAGTEVGIYAKQLFPGGAGVPYDGRVAGTTPWGW